MLDFLKDVVLACFGLFVLGFIVSLFLMSPSVVQDTA
jgi:hypothetical protein